jgi:isopentenyldiphosphate isomerase
MEEYLDVLNWKTGKKTGEVVKRSEAHQKGIPHGAIHIWVISEFNQTPHLLFQQRSFKKENFPGLLAATVGGHLSAGESVSDALRETYEEIGIQVEEKYLVHIIRYPFHMEIEGIYDDYEWISDYFISVDYPLNQYQFIDEEVIAMAAIPFTGLIQLQKNLTKEVQGLFFDGKKVSDKLFQGKDFIPDYLTGVLWEKLMNAYQKRS